MQIEEDMYMSAKFKAEILRAKKLDDLSKTLPELKNIAKEYLQETYFYVLVYLVLSSLDCQACEDTLIEKAEKSVKSFVAKELTQ